MSVPSVYAGMDGYAAFKATATLTDVLSGDKIPAQVVTFVYRADAVVAALDERSGRVDGGV